MSKFHVLIKSSFFLLIMTIQALPAQDITAIHKIKSFSQHFEAFSKSYPQEKVYLHFDNTSYYLGESIWFKAYAVGAGRNSLSNMSKILYVELLNSEGYIVETKKLKLENGECHGDFKLNASNYGGFYEVRAYTRYMLNFDVANYFSRIFPVYDTPKIPEVYTALITERPNSQRIPKIRPENNQKEQLSLNFFPEGGNMIQDVTSKVAFKATTLNGENASISGSVFNERNEKLMDINTENKLGTGSFEFTPAAGKYYAKVSCNGHEYRFNLPVAQPKGYVMTINNSNEEKQLLSLLDQINKALSQSPKPNVAQAKQVDSTTSNLLTLQIKNQGLYFSASTDTIYMLTDSSIYSFKTDGTSKKSIVTNNNTWTSPAGLANYFGNLYVLDKKQNQILKFVEADSSYTKSNYFSDNSSIDFSKASDLAIDSSVYVLSLNGKIDKFNKGTPESFNLSGLDKDLLNPTRIFVNADLTYVYVLDNGNSRIVVLEKGGKYKTQYQATVIKNAKGFDVDEKGGKAYVLSGGKIYEIELK